MELCSTLISLVLYIKTFAFEKNASIIVKKRHNANEQSLFDGWKRQKYDLIFFIILIELI